MNLSTTTESLLGIFGEDLKTFISTIIEEKAAESAIWRSPSGGKWCFISDVLGVTWYAKSKQYVSMDQRLMIWWCEYKLPLQG